MCIEIVFSRIFIFSPSVNTDPTFVEAKKYVRENMKVDDKKEKLYYEEYNAEELAQVIDTQTKIKTMRWKKYIQY